MIRKNFFKVVAALLLGFMFSCDNTTDDPINNNKNNPSTGTGGSGSTGPTITGPRILHKIIANNEITQEFVTTGGVLEKAIYREDSGPNSFLIAVVTYTSGKITKVKVDQQVNGTIPANNIAYNFDITYDSGGKINSTIGNTSVGTTAGFTSEYAYTYDGAGKMTKIVEKKKIGADYSQYTNYNFTNTGDNITKVVTETGPTTSAGVPTSTVLMTTTYNYTSYDNKINPYTTLPKTFFVIWSLMHPLNFPLLSANNLTNYNVQYNGTPMVSTDLTYLYDSMNYPTSDQTQVQKYIYKAL
ncbi:MAG: hypothetical protein K0R77_1293 [Chryseobacterium sp.]|jgi:hypothetical protein|uniref:hypothetical protein n=1 Tax=Chryseobacterium sp. TaxID=1871047 RepID=UPI0026223D0E|nr:hypothetical protein [Chryseobacterium sp.]MDF2552018.1 hypothetical protein [Chryseobacterium sp.]